MPGVGFFVSAGALRVDGPLDLAILKRTFAEVTIEDPALSCERVMAAAEREALPLDLAPLLRVVVHRIAASRHVLFLSVARPAHPAVPAARRRS